MHHISANAFTWKYTMAQRRRWCSLLRFHCAIFRAVCLRTLWKSPKGPQKVPKPTLSHYSHNEKTHFAERGDNTVVCYNIRLLRFSTNERTACKFLTNHLRVCPRFWPINFENRLLSSRPCFWPIGGEAACAEGWARESAGWTKIITPNRSTEEKDYDRNSPDGE